MKLQSTRKLFLSADSLSSCMGLHPQCVCACARVYLGDSFSSPVEGDISVSVSVIGCWPSGSVLYICLLTGCSVTNQPAGPHRGNQIVTHSLWASAGHLEIPVMFYLPLTHAYIHTRAHIKTHTHVHTYTIKKFFCFCLARRLLRISSHLRNMTSG